MSTNKIFQHICSVHCLLIMRPGRGPGNNICFIVALVGIRQQQDSFSYPLAVASGQMSFSLKDTTMQCFANLLWNNWVKLHLGKCNWTFSAAWHHDHDQWSSFHQFGENGAHCTYQQAVLDYRATYAFTRHKRETEPVLPPILIIFASLWGPLVATPRTRRRVCCVRTRRAFRPCGVGCIAS